MTPAEMVDALVPPPQFTTASFDSYIPDDDYPSQRAAVELCRGFAGNATPRRSSGRGFLSRVLFAKKSGTTKPGIYLDGGFGVGKTHLLAATWHAYPGRKYFGTFIEYTALVGALGYQNAVKAFTGASLIAIDEFELDDPGDTMVMTKLLGELVESGTCVMATSNTPPNALGEGRFAAQDFLREITKLSNVFDTVRIDGVDFRRRAVEGEAVVSEQGELEAQVERRSAAGETVAHDPFRGLVEHLARVHPSKYVKLVEGVDAIALDDVEVLTDQAEALRFVAFIDRVYDAQIPVIASGEPLDAIFGGGMVDGGYRKKYLRSVSRLIASTGAAREQEAKAAAPAE
ncbi:cell division protein ZapE [Gulosibacter sp. 10]|uniref:cell division protein ZapE n=1 Tax=Gulosibacter sp. 10 TaxID=1255570 RepID=UPI000B36229D|nr:cell division protein ZapE [Gulosibacter sp. 10]